MKRKLIRVVLGLVVAVVAVVAALILYVQLTYRRDFSATPSPDVKASTDPAVIARGEYLAHAVAHCSGCHATGLMLTDRRLPSDLKNLGGGLTIDAGPFGKFYPSNITPDPDTGIGKLSDPELARIIRDGVARDGRLDIFMSFAVGPMADEDVGALVSYLRSLPPVRNAVKEDEWGIIAKALSGSFGPNKAALPKYAPAGGVSVERGEYLANGPAACAGCHSPFDPTEGFAPSGPRFSGAAEAEPDLTDAAHEIIAPNLTPDPETGFVGKVGEDVFVQRFRSGGRAFNGSKMPWENYALMTEDDVKSIYRYLKTVPPVKRDVGPSRRAVP